MVLAPRRPKEEEEVDLDPKQSVDNNYATRAEHDTSLVRLVPLIVDGDALIHVMSWVAYLTRC